MVRGAEPRADAPSRSSGAFLGLFFTANVSKTLLESFISTAGAQTHLSPRERQVVELITEGHTNQQVAGILSLSLKTVEAHRFATMRKLNLSSSAALVRYAIRNKIVLAP